MTWYLKKEPPKKTKSRFSKEVLVVNMATFEHNVAFYDFFRDKWHILGNEHINRFKWRYFEESTDLPKKRKFNKN